MICLCAPENVSKISFDVRSCVSGFFFSLFWVFRRRRVFVSLFFKRESSGSHRAHPHTHLVFLFLFLVFVPAAPGLSPVFGRASFPSRILSGCHSGPWAFWRSRNIGGLEITRPLLRPCFSGRDAARVLLCFLCLVFVFPFLFCGCTVFLKARVGARRRSGQKIGRSRPPLGRVVPRGCASRAEGWSPPFPGF